MTKMIVIGAGVMGASVAYRLAQAGAAVTVLEATRVGGGTSGISFAWTNAHRKPPKPYHDLNVGGMKAHAALRDEFGATPGGMAAAAWNGKPRPIARRSGRMSSSCVPGATPPNGSTTNNCMNWNPTSTLPVIGDAPVAYFPDEGWLDPVVYAHAMLSAARRRHGAQVICGARVVDLVMTGDRVTGVRTADGTLHEADMVVNCAGRWTNEAVREAGLHLPLAPTVGFLVFTPPVAAGLSRVVRTSVIDARPDGAGRLMLHWNPTDALLSIDSKLSPSMPEARDLVQRARRCCPRLATRNPRRYASPFARSPAIICPPSVRCRGSADITSRSPIAA
jgi:glycine/D-amino acid oxidase-like deaminating enzyme